MGELIAQDVVAGYSMADMVLKGVSITVADGEIVSIIGPNGAGKSTFFKVVAGLLRLRQGRIRLDQHDIHGLNSRQIAARGVALIPQEGNVFPSMTVQENLEMGGYIEPKRTATRLAAIFQRFPELAEKRRQAARTLSGGQRQMLAMATALMVEPKLLLLDEPSAGLAPLAAERLFHIVRDINQEGVSIAMVEQNAVQALTISHRAYILVDGRNSRSGKAAELAADPEVRRIFLGGGP